MADAVIGLILGVIREITSIWEEMKDAGSRATRLVDRVKALEDPVRALEASNNLSKSEALQQVHAILEEARSFLAEYKATNKYKRALKRTSHADQFEYLSMELTNRVQALHLDVAVAAWPREDEKDRVEDAERMLELLEDMKISQRGNHQELVTTMEELQQDVRKQLQSQPGGGGFEEIDVKNEVEDMDDVLGRGGFSVVWKAKWRGTDVAVKALTLQNITRERVQKFSEEVRLHSGLHFDFLVHMYGASTIRPNLCLVMELAPGGSLRDYLLERGAGGVGHALQVALLYDVARGMAFLHSKGVLHRDLKSSNVLVFENQRLKLCDFGVAEYKQDAFTTTGNWGQGTVQYISPELLHRGRATEQTDLYSFGMLCFEVITCKEPFAGRTLVEIIAAVMAQERPKVPRGASPSPVVESLMLVCWKQDPARRPPNFAHVVQILRGTVEASGDPRRPASAASGAQQANDRIKQSRQAQTSAPRQMPVVEGNEVAHGNQLEQVKLRSALANLQRQSRLINLPPRGTTTGGAVWAIDGGEAEMVLRTITVWVGETKMKAVEVTLSDNWTKRKVGRSESWDGEEVLAHESFTFEKGEKMTSLSTWDNGCEDITGVRVGLRAGGFEFTTSLGRSFSVSSLNRGTRNEEDIGESVVVGAHGRCGYDVDSFNFIIQRGEL